MAKFSLLLFITLLSFSFSQDIKRKICAASANDAACQQIARNFEIGCNVYLHQVDCLLGISNNQSHVGRISGEAALLGANLLSDDVVVLGEIGTRRAPSATVVIVKTDIPNGFINLKDKKFCHPGFKHDDSFSHWLLQEFENQTIQLNETFCSQDNITLLERQIRTLNDFFGDSCRPGLWTQNRNFDKILKGRYGSLCKLCGSELCDIDHKAPFNDSLKCLLKNNADVALTTFQEAELFFSSIENVQRYKYLCKDGSSRSSTNPCLWSAELPDLIVAARSVANDIRNYLQNNVPSKINNSQETTGEDSSNLVNILSLRQTEKINLLYKISDYTSITDYVKDRRIIPTVYSSRTCGRTITWCTKSIKEQQKCEWLSQAAINRAIQPVVECRQTKDEEDTLSCLDDIRKKSADVTVISSDFAYITLKKGLTALAFPETNRHSVILAVKNANDTSIKTFEDLKGKQACIPRFGGKEHLAFVDTTQKLKVTVDDKCDYGSVLNNFVGQSCVPGVRSSIIKELTDDITKDKLCALCHSDQPQATASYCNDNEGNEYFGSNGAIKCLQEVGNFAVITKSDVNDTANLSVICKNNTLAATDGLEVDHNCALNVITSSEVVSLADNEKNADIILALYEFEKWFGEDLKKTFHLFDRFDQTLDLLFDDSTPGLNFDNDVAYVNNYKELLGTVKKCNSNANAARVSLFTIITVFLIFCMNI